MAGTAVQPSARSERRDDRFARDALVICHGPEQGVESADTEKVVIRNRDALMRWLLCLKDDVAAGFVDLPVLLFAAERPGQPLTRDVARQLHATDKTSSLTR